MQLAGARDGSGRPGSRAAHSRPTALSSLASAATAAAAAAAHAGSRTSGVVTDPTSSSPYLSFTSTRPASGGRTTPARVPPAAGTQLSSALVTASSSTASQVVAACVGNDVSVLQMLLTRPLDEVDLNAHGPLPVPGPHRSTNPLTHWTVAPANPPGATTLVKSSNSTASSSAVPLEMPLTTPLIAALHWGGPASAPDFARLQCRHRVRMLLQAGADPILRQPLSAPSSAAAFRLWNLDAAQTSWAGAAISASTEAVEAAPTWMGLPLTPLMFAVRYCRHDIATILLSFGAEPDAPRLQLPLIASVTGAPTDVAGAIVNGGAAADDARDGGSHSSAASKPPPRRASVTTTTKSIDAITATRRYAEAGRSLREAEQRMREVAPTPSSASPLSPSSTSLNGQTNAAWQLLRREGTPQGASSRSGNVCDNGGNSSSGGGGGGGGGGLSHLEQMLEDEHRTGLALPNCLFTAASFHDHAMVRLLIDAGADVNARGFSGTGGASVLRLVIGNCKVQDCEAPDTLETLRVLLQAGADTEARCWSSWQVTAAPPASASAATSAPTVAAPSAGNRLTPPTPSSPTPDAVNTAGGSPAKSIALSTTVPSPPLQQQHAPPTSTHYSLFDIGRPLDVATCRGYASIVQLLLMFGCDPTPLPFHWTPVTQSYLSADADLDNYDETMRIDFRNAISSKISAGLARDVSDVIVPGHRIRRLSQTLPVLDVVAVKEVKEEDVAGTADAVGEQCTKRNGVADDAATATRVSTTSTAAAASSTASNPIPLTSRRILPGDPGTGDLLRSSAARHISQISGSTDRHVAFREGREVMIDYLSEAVRAGHVGVVEACRKAIQSTLIRSGGAAAHSGKPIVTQGQSQRCEWVPRPERAASIDSSRRKEW